MSGLLYGFIRQSPDRLKTGNEVGRQGDIEAAPRSSTPHYASLPFPNAGGRTALAED